MEKMQKMKRMQEKTVIVYHMKERPYEKLIVWQESHKLCLRVYTLTRGFPAEEKYSLVSQMRRSSYSVPTNIAEGNARRTKAEKVRFLDIAIASLEELHYQGLLARDLSYIPKKKFEEMDQHVGRVGYLLHKTRFSLL